MLEFGREVVWFTGFKEVSKKDPFLKVNGEGVFEMKTFPPRTGTRVGVLLSPSHSPCLGRVSSYPVSGGI